MTELQFRSHIELAQSYWEEIIQPGDLVIDATAGNGHDTLFLAKKTANLISIDKQLAAIQATKQRLEIHQPMHHIRLIHQCHSTFPENLEPGSVKLIVYNLGYLPGGDKSLTTMCSSTQKSLAAAQNLIQRGGMISITCYPGHTEGKKEESLVLKFAAALDPKEWQCCHHRWINRKASPSLLIIQKKN